MSTSLDQSASPRLWERFQTGACSLREIQSSLLLQRWARCREAGLSADNPGEPRVALERLPEAHDRFATVLAPGAPFDAFATTIAQAGFCGLFCDDTGLVVARRIAEPYQSAIVETRVIEGAIWSEDARGTNGVGTALVERGPVSVVGAEHYERRNHALACYSAPVRDIRERIVAVLDATGPVSADGGFIHASVVATAAAIEALIVARTYDAALPGGLFELEQLIARLPHATLVVEATGHVRRANARLRGLLGEAQAIDFARAVGSSLLRTPAKTAMRLEEPPHSLRGIDIELEPIGRPDDPFAALVHLRSRRKRARPSLAAHEALPAAFAPILGSDPVLATARARAARFAASDLPLLLLGETGTGKELFARAVHGASPRADAPFMAVNCGALTGTLLESELFGYAPGAFTGAAPGGRVGKLAAAQGGTLFLDEIGEMTPPVQAMLLRFLEDGSFFRVGDAVEQRAEVRLVAATNRNLAALVEEGRFRDDLYFRMRGVVLRLPALRERTDRRELAEALLAGLTAPSGRPRPLPISPAAFAWIDRHPWPGNVRELKTALLYAIVLAGDEPRVEPWHLPLEESMPASEEGDPLSSAERTVLLRALDHSRGNLSDAARYLGVARSTLYRMMARQGLAGDESGATDVTGH